MTRPRMELIFTYYVPYGIFIVFVQYSAYARVIQLRSLLHCSACGNLMEVERKLPYRYNADNRSYLVKSVEPRALG